jgi:hypothetical protein
MSDEWDGTDYGPEAPHWYDFKEIARDPWSFRFIETGLAVLEAEPHRFWIETELVEDGTRTHRVWQICYEPTSVDPTADDVDERVPIFLGSGSTAIPRNNILAGRESLSQGDEQVVVIREDDDERGVRVPSARIAEMAADEISKVGIESDRDLIAITYSPERWERNQELKEELETTGGDRR